MGTTKSRTAAWISRGARSSGASAAPRGSSKARLPRTRMDSRTPSSSVDDRAGNVCGMKQAEGRDAHASEHLHAHATKYKICLTHSHTTSSGHNSHRSFLLPLEAIFSLNSLWLAHPESAPRHGEHTRRAQRAAQVHGFRGRQIRRRSAGVLPRDPSTGAGGKVRRSMASHGRAVGGCPWPSRRRSGRRYLWPRFLGGQGNYSRWTKYSNPSAVSNPRPAKVNVEHDFVEFVLPRFVSSIHRDTLAGALTFWGFGAEGVQAV